MSFNKVHTKVVSALHPLMKNKGTFLKSLFTCLFISCVLTQYVSAQACTGSSGTISLTVFNNGATPSKVDLGWSHSTGQSGGWQSWNDQASFKLSSNPTYTDCESTITGLIPGMMYDFKVRGTRFCGREGFEGVGQNVVATSTNFLLKPAIPTISPATNVGTNSFTANWVTVGAVAHFYVDVSTSPSFSTLIYSNLDAGTNTSIVIGNLNSSMTYYYRVRGSNSSGTSTNSTPSQPVITLIAIPTMLSPDSVGSHSFIAKWEAIPRAEMYWIEVATDQAFTTLVDGYNGISVTTLYHRIAGLIPQTMYYYRLRASNANGASEYSHTGQVMTPAVAFIETGSTTEKPFEVNIIPPSPEAAALAKYADIPVSLYSGIPSISVPLYTIKERELSLPIAMSYHAGGHKVETVAPRTGLGWTLNAGGVVTRTVRGWPDEHPFRGFLSQARYYHDIGTILSLPVEQRYQAYNEMAFGCVDAEPDIFYFNFLGYTGQFMFDWDGQIKILTPNSIKIEPIGLADANDDFIDGWKFTVDDGTTFTFTAIETTQILQTYSGGSACEFIQQINQRHMPQAWYITEMRSANQQSWMRFEYDSYRQQNEMWSLETQVHNIALSPAEPKKEKLKVVNEGVNLRKITVSSGQTVVDFLPSAEARFDVSSNPDAGIWDNYPLGQINVNNSNGKQVAHWDLAYTHSTGRLTLAAIMENVGGIAKPPYEFLYKGGLPSTTSLARDHWGFYNNNSAGTLIPATTHLRVGDANPTELSGANRSPSAERATAGMLYQITYPTGGKDIMEFESHDYSFEQNVELIKELTVSRSQGATVPSSNINSNTHVSTDVNTFVLTGITDVHVVASFSYGMTGFGYGGQYNPSYSITNAQGARIDGLSIPPGSKELNASYTLYKLPAGTYTITASVKVPDTELKNSVSVVLSWQEGTHVFETEVRQGGGVRIAKITRSFGNGNPDKVTRYKYRITEDGRIKSSGSLLESGYVYEKGMSYALSNGSQFNIIEKFVRFSQNRSSLGTTQGSHVGYSHVTVLNGEHGQNGRSVYRYTSPREFPDFASFDVPFPPAQSFDYLRGLLMEQADFASASNDTIRKVINTYTSFDLDIPALKVGWQIIGSIQQGPTLADILFAPGPYTTRLGYTRLEQTRERVMNPGFPAVETLTTYTYNETTHKQLVSTSTKNSKDETIVTSLKYPLDYGTSVSVINAMKDRHMDNVPIEKLTWKAGTGGQAYLLSGIKTDFNLNNGKIFPVTKHGAKITTPVATTNPYEAVRTLYEPRIAFSKYDGYNNLKEHGVPNGVKTSYQWNYAGTLPTAKADNALANQIFFESFEEDATASTLQYRTGVKSKAIAGKYTVPTASRPTSNGAYVLSYWTKEGSESWTYVEKNIQYVTGTAIQSDTHNGYIDDVRIYPKGALMTTYTYEPLVGVTSITDPANVTSYFEYDDIGRLKCTRDQDHNIIRCYDYQYQVEIPFVVQH